MGKIIILGSEKGGVAKTTSTYNLAYCLAKEGKKVLAVDFDSQANLSTCFGIEDTRAVPVTIGHLMMQRIEDEELPDAAEYIQSRNGVDFIPSSIMLSVVEAKLRLEMGAERMLAGILELLKGRYDYILVDTCPSLGSLTINALSAADGVIITVNPQLLAMMGLQDFLKTVKKIRGRINPGLRVEGLPDAEAYVYVIETNMLQRSFNDLSVSERIAVLAERYDKVCGTKKREEILAELQALNGGGGHDVHQQAKSRELLGKELGLTGRHVARYVRCKELIPEFKDMLDDGSLTMVSAVELSYLPEEEQAAVKKVMDQNCIRLKADKAGELRKAAGSLSEEAAQKILGVDRPVKTDAEKPVSVKLPAKLYSRYFTNVAAKDVQGILEAALEQYFEGKGA